ncbi:cell division protease FtsH [[Eubacterium] yurii]|nr:cell division protease FtsH [[Eubacterium] yurii]
MKNIKEIVFLLFVILIFAFGARIFDIGGGGKSNLVAFSEVYNNLEKNNIKKIEFTDQKITGETYNGQKFESYMPTVIDKSTFTQMLLEKTRDGLEIIGTPDERTSSWIINFIPSIILIVVLTGVLFFSMRQNAQGGGGGNMPTPFGNSAFGNKDRPKTLEIDNKIKFENVAGLDEEKEELQEVVDFLKNPKKYSDLGARIPKGMLMIGSPGTGKTYLSKAVAGEAGVPFYSISGSGFVEMYVGVGAARVRELFDQAKKTAPCIVFIDEIDAVGRKRGAGLGGGHDEREQTLNQLLVEMDGFIDNQGVIVMAATNRPDILDPALLRPGRFDREIVVGIPDLKGREEILKVHSKNKPLDDDVNLTTIARRIPGFTPADIENIMNEAAILTARANLTKINMEIIEEAITKVIAGIPKKSRIISDKEKKLVAYHEAGHAVIARSLPDYDPVHHVTIIPRGRAGGFTMTLPEDDVNYVTKRNMQDRLVELLGGRLAEEIVLDDISTGAQNDLERVSQIARSMVTKYAFSENLPSMSFGDSSDEVFLGRDFTTRRNYSEEVASQIDKEIEKIVSVAYDRCKSILTEHIDNLHSVANALIKFETLDKVQFEKAYNGEMDVSLEEVGDKAEA